MNKCNAKILILDIETSPLTVSTWGLFDQNIALNQIVEDWSILSYAAKWVGDKKVHYADQRSSKNVRDDKKLLQGIWKLMDEADIILGQNSKSFDVKKLNARFLLNGMKPPSGYRQLDTMRIAKKYFAMTSNKLEYLSNKLCTKYKKLNHKKFGGFDLWKECLAGNKKAWKEMERYNIYDVLATEELYLKLQPWDNSINFNLYTDALTTGCSCGNNTWTKNGFTYRSTGKYQRFTCKACGAETIEAKNLLSKEKRQSLLRKA